MDDFGNLYQTDEWWMSCTQYGYSACTFGFFDDECIDLCIVHCIDYAAMEI